MRSASLAYVAVFSAVALAAACDSTLNLGGGEGGASPDAGPPTCASTCDKLVACGFAVPEQRPACVSECTGLGTAEDLACVARTACSEMQAVCGKGAPTPAADAGVSDFDRTVCQARCDRLNFFECTSASELSACRYLCETTASASKRSAFEACVDGSRGDCARGVECLTVFKQ